MGLWAKDKHQAMCLPGGFTGTTAVGHPSPTRDLTVGSGSGPRYLPGRSLPEAALAAKEQVVQSSSSDKAVAGPLETGCAPDDFKEHQALLKRVAANLNLQIEDIAEESDSLFNVISFATLARVVLPVHAEVLQIAKSL
ncbi:hypothetical protein UY3_11914 [Chelonia mydas]|uniref:Uncharacterized protein n=1 Tax=Chelonia mydas TaxID=8469 RepID=M7BS52_CHEMY|nr:hypothetical protein UY3_11914 [Chelonia mydas]